MGQNNKLYVQIGAMLGILLSVLVICLILVGVYSVNLYNQIQIDKQNAIDAENARIDRIVVKNTGYCNSMGYNSYRYDTNTCYTEKNIESTSKDYEYKSRNLG